VYDICYLCAKHARKADFVRIFGYEERVITVPNSVVPLTTPPWHGRILIVRIRVRARLALAGVLRCRQTELRAF
jgi:hypothetical protein